MSKSFSTEPGTDETLITVLDTLDIGTALLDHHGKIQWINQLLRNWFPPSPAFDQNPVNFLCQQSHSPCTIQEAFTSGERVAQEFRLTDEQGEEKFYMAAVYPLNNLGSTQYRYLFSLHDITRTRKASIEAQHTMLMQEAIYQVAAVSVSVESLEELFASLHKIIGRIMPADNFYIALQDQTNGAINFPYFSDEQDPGPIPSLPADNKSITGYVLRTGRSLLCTKAISKQLAQKGLVEMYGPEPQIWLGVPLIVDERSIGVMAVQHYTDPEAYTEQEKKLLEFVSVEVAKAIQAKRGQETILQAEKRISNIVEASPLGLISYQLTPSDDLILIEANPSASKILGIDCQRLLGKSIQVAFPNLVNTALPDIYRNLAINGGMYSTQQFNYKDENVEGAFEVYAFQISPNRIAVMFQDITSRLEQEFKIKELNESLEERVQQRTTELEAFAYSVSHDLRAPVRAIKGFTEMISQDSENQFSPESQELLLRVLASSQKMDNLINDLLALSQLGSQGLNIVQVNLSELVRKVKDHLRVDFPTDHVSIRVDDTPSLLADRSQMEILITNLLSNAIKFTRNTPEPAIHFGSTSNEGQTTFFLKDNGIGFEMEYQRKIFTPFERLNPTEYEGTGIGLAIVNRIVQRHKGDIWVNSRPGLGSTFYFSIPQEFPKSD